ncbi:GNAT family N-acetyltransferase [Streptomyces sp. NPDC016309]|uniref:GNAT family N-acetyltransferase n=1 Tax=Streptomyces sp. NPDC016309 TaxID=3364965 RepID=UPI0036F8BB9B
MTGPLRLEKITAANFETAIALKVRPDQEHLVAPVVRSLAEAYVHPDVAWPRLILDGDRPVGFLMAFFDIDFADDSTGTGTDLRSGLWRLNIAAGEQGRGYGRFAVRAVAAEIRRRGGTRLTVTWHPGDDGPEAFYLGLGFRPTGEMSGNQRVGELALDEIRSDRPPTTAATATVAATAATATATAGDGAA